MANLTLFQRLSKVFSVDYTTNNYSDSASIPKSNDTSYVADDNTEQKRKLLQARQQNLLARQWKKASYDITNKSLANLNNIKMMYRDADIMDDFPEIGTALDIVMEESTYIGDKGFIINISSKSERIKSILQDLFVNRLMINTQLPMICRTTCKYGNTFMLLNIDENNGITGWKMLPVYEVERYENGMENPYANAYVNLNNVTEKSDISTKFVWVGQNSYIPYYNWQIAHFRLLYNSLYLPYGMSFLNKARRHFRMLSMMEDMMLIYRLERSIERRVFKINVGAIDEADVPAYVQQIADNFKRTPIVDPQTGQIDLRKNLLPVWRKTPIPLLDGRTITIEDVAKEYENGKTNYVYSIQDKTLMTVPGEIVWCGKNYTADSMIKVTLDNDTYMVMAPEHEVLMIDGTKKRADKLIYGESVMVLCGACEMKVKKTETINGDDVYCMTVVGLNGEDDRHNFALMTFKGNDEWSDCGCFVSNCESSDFFIPVREDNAANPIETLPAAQNLTAMDDIKFMQNKVLTALRVPKSFLNFEETQGDGKNLSLLDVRFSRTVNRIQQSLIMELNKVAMIHLMLLGFGDELTNFTITMNNPSSQAEMLELENMAKKVTTAKDAITDGGNGIPLMSVTRAWKTIMKWSDKEISDNLEELRLEKALAAELERTSEIIKRTGVFDPIDNIYGEAGAEYSEQPQEEDDGSLQGKGGAGGGFMGGGSLDFGDELSGEENTSDIEGAEGELDMDTAASEDNENIAQPENFESTSGDGLGESYMRNMLAEIKNRQAKVNKQLSEKGAHYLELLKKRIKEETQKKNNDSDSNIPLFDDTFLINEELNDLYNKLGKITAI